MKNTLLMLVVLGMAMAMVSGCGEPSFAQLADRKFVLMKDMNRTLATVKDAGSAQRAVPKVERLVAQLEELDAQAEQYDGLAEISQMDEGAQKRLLAKLGESRAVQDQFDAELSRIEADPELSTPLVGVLPGLDD